ncbi:MAG: AAA family ATPase [Phycisphaerae bacterium]|nr:AAA family ATPase [Phycisphaerae bacterium]
MAETPSFDDAARQELETIQSLVKTRERMRQEIGRRIIGQAQVIEDLLTAMFAQGHALLIGVPGLAKTLMVSTIADIMDLSFTRIQFTPDLMPADITGTEVLEEDRATGRRAFRFVRGPVFANIVLADEINRTPPKTQAALLQAMQERAVSVVGTTHPLPKPFFVLATQNPIEQEGTYPLPEAQLDRFMFALRVDYPTAQEELAIARTTTGQGMASVSKLVNAEQVIKLQNLVRRVPVSDHVASYAVRLARATRPGSPEAPEAVRRFVAWGAGPRAVQYLVLGAKARAILGGSTNVSCAHIREVAPIVLRHRVLTNFAAEAEGIDSDQLVQRLIQTIPESPGTKQ